MTILLFTLRLIIECAAPTPPGAGPMREVFPGVRINDARTVMEFDARTSPMLVRDDRAPLFFLEVLVCTPDTREHETLAVTSVRPSHIHAALLLLGAAPGTPGGFTFENNRLLPVQPTGEPLDVRFVHRADFGLQIESDPLDWIVNSRNRARFLDTERRIAPGPPAPGFLFTGSRMRTRDGREVYDADGSGTVVGLTTFGSEVIGWSRVISPEANIQEPEWIADFSRTPPGDTPIKVRVTRRK